MDVGECAVKEALKRGATEAEAYTQRVKTVHIEFDRKINQVRTAESGGLGVRVSLGKRSALCATSLLDPEEVREAAATAVKMARVTPEDVDWERMNTRFGTGKAEGYYDKMVETLDYSEIGEVIHRALACVRDYDERATVTRGMLTLRLLTVSLATCHDVRCERKETRIEAFVKTKAEEAGMKSTGREEQEARFWKEINLEELALTAAERAVAFLRTSPVPSGEMPAVVKNRVFATLLDKVMTRPITADWVQEGKSPLSGQVGAEISSEEVTLVDDGLRYGGYGTKPFDGEGHPTQTNVVIEKGVLKTYLYDTYTALKDHRESTGNAQRPHYWSALEIGPNNLVLNPGKMRAEEMVEEMSRGICIEQTIGEKFSSPESGDLAFTVTHAYLVEGGECTRRIKGAVIAGNVYDLLKNGMESVGSDLRNYGTTYAPTVTLAKVRIAGE